MMYLFSFYIFLRILCDLVCVWIIVYLCLSGGLVVWKEHNQGHVLLGSRQGELEGTFRKEGIRLGPIILPHFFGQQFQCLWHLHASASSFQWKWKIKRAAGLEMGWPGAISCVWGEWRSRCWRYCIWQRDIQWTPEFHTSWLDRSRPNISILEGLCVSASASSPSFPLQDANVQGQTAGEGHEWRLPCAETVDLPDAERCQDNFLGCMLCGSYQWACGRHAQQSLQRGWPPMWQGVAIQTCGKIFPWSLGWAWV